MKRRMDLEALAVWALELAEPQVPLPFEIQRLHREARLLYFAWPRKDRTTRQHLEAAVLALAHAIATPRRAHGWLDEAARWLRAADRERQGVAV